MKPADIKQELQNQRSHFSGSGGYILYINTTNYSITIWEISKALNDGKSKFTNSDYQRLSALQSKPNQIKNTKNGIWVGPFNKFEALGFAYYLNNKTLIRENKTFSIDSSRI